MIQVGDIVRLKNPYKPDLLGPEKNIADTLSGARRRMPSGETVDPQVRINWVYGAGFQEWPGFTHGIVVEIVSTERVMVPGGPEGVDRWYESVPRSVSLHVYDPERGVVYMGPNGIPMYVDYHVSELILHHVATDEGYDTAAPEPEAANGQE